MSDGQEEETSTSVFSSIVDAISGARQTATEEFSRFWGYLSNDRKIITPRRLRSEQSFSMPESSTFGRVFTDIERRNIICDAEVQADISSFSDSRKRKAQNEEPVPQPFKKPNYALNNDRASFSIHSERDKSPLISDVKTGEKSVRRLTLELEKKSPFQQRHFDFTPRNSLDSSVSPNKPYTPASPSRFNAATSPSKLYTAVSPSRLHTPAALSEPYTSELLNRQDTFKKLDVTKSPSNVYTAESTHRQDTSKKIDANESRRRLGSDADITARIERLEEKLKLAKAQANILNEGNIPSSPQPTHAISPTRNTILSEQDAFWNNATDTTTSSLNFLKGSYQTSTRRSFSNPTKVTPAAPPSSTGYNSLIQNKQTSPVITSTSTYQPLTRSRLPSSPIKELSSTSTSDKKQSPPVLNSNPTYQSTTRRSFSSPIKEIPVAAPASAYLRSPVKQTSSMTSLTSTFQPTAKNTFSSSVKEIPPAPSPPAATNSPVRNKQVPDRYKSKMREVIQLIPGVKLKRTDTIIGADGVKRPNPFWVEIYGKM